MKKDIGILGATGLVGKGVLSALEGKKCTILIGARNLEKLKQIKSKSQGNIEIISIDVLDAKQVEKFCSQCKIIINCTSPASAIGTRILEECVNQGIDYIDPFGEGQSEKYIADNRKKVEEKKCRIILAAGTYPGLSEMLFKYVLKDNDYEKICIKEFFYGNGCFSYGATQDIIFSMLNGKSKSMSFVKGEEVVPCNIPFGSSITIEPNIGPIYPYPIISEDFYKVCKGKVQEAYFFNTFSDINSVSSFFEIGSQIFYENRECAYNYTEKLKQLYDKEGVGIERTEFVFFVEKKNEPINKRIVFEYLCNWNTLSGYICAWVAEQCLKNTLSKICVCKFSEIDATKNLVNNLPGKIEIKEQNVLLE